MTVESGSGQGPVGTVTPTPGQVSVVEYSDEAWNNSPVMRFLRGEIGLGEFMTLNSAPTQVPGRNIVLPPINQIPLTTLQAILQSPSTYQLLKQLFAAANRDLDAEIALLSSLFPASNPVPTSVVKT